MLGVGVTKGDVNYRAGLIALALKIAFDQAVSLKEFFDRVGTAGLEEMGFTAGEAATLISAYNDLAYQKAASFDSSVHVKALYGTGFSGPNMNTPAFPPMV